MAAAVQNIKDVAIKVFIYLLNDWHLIQFGRGSFSPIFAILYSWFISRFSHKPCHVQSWENWRVDLQPAGCHQCKPASCNGRCHRFAISSAIKLSNFKLQISTSGLIAMRSPLTPAFRVYLGRQNCSARSNTSCKPRCHFFVLCNKNTIQIEIQWSGLQL